MTHNTSGGDSNGLSDKNTETPSFGESVAHAARRMGLGAAADGSEVSGRAVLAAMGGIRGIVEATLPGLVFLVVYTITRDVVIAVSGPLVVSIIFLVVRLVQRQSPVQAISGFFGIAISAALALLSGQAEQFYLPGFLTNAAYGAALLVSVFVRWPLIGLAAGFLMGDGVAWRKDPLKYRLMMILTLVWVGMFALRLAVQLPLYFAGNVEALGATRLIMGLPLYAPVLIVSWLMVRSAYRVTRPADGVRSADD